MTTDKRTIGLATAREVQEILVLRITGEHEGIIGSLTSRILLDQFINQ